MQEIEEKVIYQPCKKCQAMNYNNCDFQIIEENSDGDFIVCPDTCDKCNFMLMLSDSNEIH